MRRSRVGPEVHAASIILALVRLTFFRSAARGLHTPAARRAASRKNEARKRRASERPRVGCCEELGGAVLEVERSAAARLGIGSKSESNAGPAKHLLASNGEIRYERELFTAFPHVRFETIVSTPRPLLCNHRYLRTWLTVRTSFSYISQAPSNGLAVVFWVKVKGGDAK